MTHTVIPREEWQSFCTEFSRRHDGERAMISVVDSFRVQVHPEEVDDPLAVVDRDTEFHGIQADRKGQDHVELEIEAGYGPRHRQHVVVLPREMRVERSESGDECGLWIDEPAGRTTVLRFYGDAIPKSSGSVEET